MEPTLKDKTARGVFWGTLNSGATELLNVVIGIFLARLLLPEDYGLVGMLAIFTAIAGNLQSWGFTNALINKKPPLTEDYNAVFWFNVLVSVTLYAILFLAAPLIAAYFRQERLVALARFIFIAFVIGACGITANAYMLKNMMNRELAVVNVTGLVVSGIVGITLALNGAAYWSLAWQQVTYIVAINLLRYFYTWKRWHPSWRINLRPIRPMLGFSVKILVTNVVNTVSTNVLTFIFGRVFPLKTVGNFTQSNKWDTMAFTFVQNSVSQILQPVLVNVGGDGEREARVVRKFTRFMALVSFPVMLGLALVAPEFIHLTIGDKWSDCVPLLQILCVGGAFFPFYTIWQNVAVSHGRSDIYMWVNIAQLVLQVLLVLACYRLGIVPMVAAYSAFVILWLAVWHLATRRLSGVTLWQALCDLMPFLLVTLLVLGVTYAATLWITHAAILLMTRVLLAAVLYCAVMKLARVKIFKECLQFIKQKRKH